MFAFVGLPFQLCPGPQLEEGVPTERKKDTQCVRDLQKASHQYSTGEEMNATVSQKGPRNAPGEVPSPSGEQRQSPLLVLGQTEGTQPGAGLPWVTSQEIIREPPQHH